MKRILYALGGACLAAALVSTPALGGSGVNGVFNLGVSNSVNGITTLTGSTGGPQLKVINTNGAYEVDDGSAPRRGPHREEIKRQRKRAAAQAAARLYPVANSATSSATRSGANEMRS
jgi:hypothetical protein